MLGHRSYMYSLELLLFYLIFHTQSTHVQVPEYYFHSSQIVSKTKLDFGNDCTDTGGTIYSHGQKWTESGTCSQSLCYNGKWNNFVVKYLCRAVLDTELADTTNCEITYDISYSYPHCCPVITCADDQVRPTMATCVDRSPADACTFWIGKGGCDPDSYYFRYTSVGCRQSCSFC